jgi:hypothetical protein
VFRWIDFAADFKLLNRRMHNKLYIADGSFVISGGRNIGEDYFEYLAPDVFRSRDLMGVGPLAHEASAAFDLYWNSDWAVPVEMAVDPVPSEEEGQAFRKILARAGNQPSSYPPGYRDIGGIARARTKLAGELLWGDESHPDYDLDMPQLLLTEKLRETGIHVLDPLDHFRRQAGCRYLNDTHLNPVGLDLLSSAIQDEMRGAWPAPPERRDPP